MTNRDGRIKDCSEPRLSHSMPEYNILSQSLIRKFDFFKRLTAKRGAASNEERLVEAVSIRTWEVIQKLEKVENRSRQIVDILVADTPSNCMSIGISFKTPENLCNPSVQNNTVLIDKEHNLA